MKIHLLEFIFLEAIIFLIFFGSIIKGKLTFGGAFSALIIGTLVSLCGFEFLSIMASFFFSSIKVTELHNKIKINLLGKSYFKDKKRNAFQVSAKGLFPSLICLVLYFFSEEEKNLFEYYLKHRNNENVIIQIFLIGTFIGFFESANADTWASELGISSKSFPVFILDGFKPVPKGINGAISIYGTFCSILGGLLIALVSIISFALRTGIFQIISNFKKEFLIFSIKLLFVGSLTGFLGSLIDSLLGETVQLSIYNETKKCIIEKKMELESIQNGESLKYYGKDILNNTQINFFMGVISSLISGYIFTKII